ncbi:GNAT family N-acetyltransferase [Aquimarina celericrescens]|uniref:GNAT family N-acetyltransferase n=1 Tax=Aquimarina celericrescens TaxID=1964542 RepID=A0ABW5AVU3_9FLAO|nr:GNAT family N-acetyltransferase [Aquimarina celericrescens]
MKYTITTDEQPNTIELLELYKQTSWAKNRTTEDVALMLRNTTIRTAIKTDNKLIGFGRALTDGVYRAMLDDIVVDKKYRAQGFGKIIVEELLRQLNGVEQIFLNTKPELESFYKTFGFSKCQAFTMDL